MPRIRLSLGQKYGYYVIWHSDGKKWEVIPDILEMGGGFDQSLQLIGSTSEIHPEIKVANAMAMSKTAGKI